MLSKQMAHIPVSTQTNLDLSLFIKIPSYFCLSLSRNHGNQGEIFLFFCQSGRCSAASKKDDLGYFSLFLSSINSFSKSSCLSSMSPLTLTHFLLFLSSRLSALYLRLLHVCLYPPPSLIYTHLNLSPSLCSVHPAPARKKR